MDAIKWLREYLKDGPKETRDVSLAAKSAGLTKGELREAKQLCRVVTTNDRSGSRPPRKWFWSLPEDEK